MTKCSAISEHMTSPRSSQTAIMNIVTVNTEPRYRCIFCADIRLEESHCVLLSEAFRTKTCQNARWY